MGRCIASMGGWLVLEVLPWSGVLLQVWGALAVAVLVLAFWVVSLQVVVSVGCHLELVGLLVCRVEAIW